MSNLTDLTGQTFGSLLVIRRASCDEKNNCFWECLCSCGNTIVIKGSRLTGKRIRSCGCKSNKGGFKHGLSETKLYGIRKGMLHRCYNPTNKSFKTYGGKGIGVCNDWRYNPSSFLEWAEENKYKEGMSLDRLDNEGDYCPENCRFIPISEQSYNRKTNNNITFRGETRNITEWAKHLKIPRSTLSKRIHKFKWSIERAFTTPVKQRRKDRE